MRGNGARRRRNARRAHHARRTVVRPGVGKAQAQDTSTVALVDAAISTDNEDFEALVVSGATGLALGPRDARWDAAAADKATRAWAGADDAPNEKYGRAFFIKDGDGTEFGDYRLGFAAPADGTLTANWGGVTAVAGALSGARGGVKGLTDAEVTGVKSRVAGYYTAARKKYDDQGIKPPWEAAEEASIRFATEQGLDVFTDEDGHYAGMGGDFNPVELVTRQRFAAATALAYAELGPGVGTTDDEIGAEQALFAAAVKLWDAALADDGDAEAEAADMAPCAGCDHAYTDHLGTEGPCTLEECSCNGYEAAENDNDGDEASAAAGLAVAHAIRASLEAQGLSPLALTVRKPDGTTATVTFDDTVGDTLPDEHKPGARVPPRRPGPAAPASVLPSGEVAWTAILAPEGKLTSDGRAFAPGSIRWRDLPLTLMAMTETSEGGHVGAEVAGRIDRIWRDEKAGLIRAAGVFSSDEYGQKIAGLVDDKVLRGNSVDLAVHQWVSGPRSDWFDADGNWAPKPDAEQDQRPLLDIVAEAADDPIISVVFDAEIGMSTVCPFPAFAEAQIAIGDSLAAAAQSDSIWTVRQQAGFVLTESPVPDALTASAATDAPPTGEAPTSPEGDGREALTASAAGLAPEAPPASWFEAPASDEYEGSIVVEDDGRVHGFAAVWDTCHLGFPGQCVEPPHSESGYAYFHLGEVVCENGERVAVGTVTLDTGHAAHELGRAGATAHYDDTGTAIAYVRVGENDTGIWVAGTLAAQADAEKVQKLRGAKLSGDWRGVNGARELVALLAVNVPGFPVPRPRALVASSDTGEEILLALTAAGIPFLAEIDLTPDEREQFEALRLAGEFDKIAAEAA